MDESIGYLQDISVKVKTTPAISQLIERQPALKSIKSKVKKDKTLSLEDLRELKTFLHKDIPGALEGNALDAALEEMLKRGEKFKSSTTGPFLHEMLEGGEMKLPANPVVERNPELTSRLVRLKREQDEREYQQMTKGVSTGKFHKEDTIAFQMQMMNRQMIAVGQVVLSVAAGFAFGFFGMPLMIGGLEFGVRLLFGMLAAIIIAVAELYFLGKYLSADDEFLDKASQAHIEPVSSTKRLHQD